MTSSLLNEIHKAENRFTSETLHIKVGFKKKSVFTEDKIWEKSVILGKPYCLPQRLKSTGF